jgi:three-Cys-motif partner protein
MTDPAAKDLPPGSCTVVKWHTRQKHEFLRQYLAVWTDSVGRRAGITIPTLEIVDLFASRGWCRVDPETDRGAPLAPWPGTAILATRALQAYGRPKGLILNSFDPAGAEESGAQLASLKSAVRVELGGAARFPVTYLSGNAQDVAGDALTRVDLRFPSIWILDPATPKELPWSVVERIATSSREYPTKMGTGTRVRRPELFLTLITEGLQRNTELSPESMSSALGMALSEWGPWVEELEDRGLNRRQALIYIYTERLRDIYHQSPSFIEVEGSQGNVIYAVIFCSSSTAGTFMAKRVMKSSFRAWKRAEWLPSAKLVAKNRSIARKQGPTAPMQTSLEGYTVPEVAERARSDESTAEWNP